MDEMEYTQELPTEEPAQQPVDEQPAAEPEMACEEQEVILVEPVKKKKRGAKIFRAILSCFLTLVIVAVGSGATAVYLHQYWGDEIKRNEQMIHQMEMTIADLKEQIRDNSFTGNGNSVSGTPNTNADGLTPAQIYAQNVKSVVAISATVTGNVLGQETQGTSSGSGFILSADGYVVTNYHVVENASKVAVITHDGIQHPAHLIGGDSSNDIAVLKIEVQGLQPVKLGSSDDLIVGDQVVAIGNPLGELISTLTVGYISARDRDVNTDGSVINMLQTDAAINSGNSGGPLFNMKGEVVGITTAKYSGTTNSGATIEGIGFAIPMDDVLKKITDLRDYGYITGAALGVMVHDMDKKTAEYYGLPMGAYVVEVVAGNCAAAAGVLPKDIIIAIGDDMVTSLNELSRVLEQYQGGEQTTITVWRGGREVVLDITLDARKNN